MRRESHGFADVPDLTCNRIQFLDKANGGAGHEGDDPASREKERASEPEMEQARAPRSVDRDLGL